MSKPELSKLRRQIRQRILQGEKKHLLFREYRNYLSAFDLVRFLDSIPSLDFRKKFKQDNLFLLFVTGMAGVFEFFLNTEYVSLPWNLFLIYTIIRFNTKYYGWIWFKGVLMFLLIPFLFYFHTYTKDVDILPVTGWITTVLFSSYLAFKLEKKQEQEDGLTSVRGNFYLESESTGAI